MTERIAKALDTLRSQVNKAFPKRRKDSDGWIGDKAHRARKSDHNPNKAGVVQALDITHDPASGVNSYMLAEMLRLKKDPRIKNIISNRKIMAGVEGPRPWQWRTYSGQNAHDHHVHISVRDQAQYYDDGKEWDLGNFTDKDRIVPKPAKPYVPPPPTLREGDEGINVKRLQELIGVKNDGIFGWRTKREIVAHQKRWGIYPDGIVGPVTWSYLLGKSK